MMQSLDDAQLMRRIRQQEADALQELFARYGNAVYSLAYRVLGNAGYAEECTQDAFMIVWKRAEQWDAEKGKLVTWILAITRNLAIDRLRKEGRQPPMMEQSYDDAAGQIGEWGQVDTPLWSDGQRLQTLLTHLAPEQLQVIQLGFFYGMTHTQIAEHLGIPLGTVKTRARSGLQKLREMWLAEDG